MLCLVSRLFLPQPSLPVLDSPSETYSLLCGQRQGFVVSATVDGQRLDVALSQLTAETRSQIKVLIDEQRVWVNGLFKKASYLVSAGERIEVLPLPAALTTTEPQDIPLEILYEDDYLAAINKPPGMVVHPAPGQWSGTVANALLFRWGWNDNADAFRPGIVHRLDKDTSGVLLVAKNRQILERLSHAFKERKVHKTYLAVAFGRLATASGTIELPIGRHPIDRKKMAVRAHGGRAALSRYRKVAETKTLSLLHLFPETGRTHQLRVHLTAIGHPIVGDKVYGGGSRSVGVSDPLVQTFPRQALHAESIVLCHPLTGRDLTIRAPYPADVLSLLTLFPGSTAELDPLLLPVDEKKEIDYH
ncbi:MAG: RluA family pseudouridine synthase [Deltaproteobacteria bacterium]|nr:RluA family pseudouridine synthase [Deltaproteobacteria bacterium]